VITTTDCGGGLPDKLDRFRGSLLTLSHSTRPNAIHTKNVNTMNSKSEWLRWMNYGRPREGNEATRRLTSTANGSRVHTNG
jgi:hypothetical protein